MCFGAGIVDFDNGGRPDILIASGSVYPEVARVSPRFPERSPRHLFRNQGNGTFRHIADSGPCGQVIPVDVGTENALMWAGLAKRCW